MKRMVILVYFIVALVISTTKVNGAIFNGQEYDVENNVEGDVSTEVNFDLEQTMDVYNYMFRTKSDLNLIANEENEISYFNLLKELIEYDQISESNIDDINHAEGNNTVELQSDWPLWFKMAIIGIQDSKVVEFLGRAFSIVGTIWAFRIWVEDVIAFGSTYGYDMTFSPNAGVFWGEIKVGGFLTYAAIKFYILMSKVIKTIISIFVGIGLLINVITTVLLYIIERVVNYASNAISRGFSARLGVRCWWIGCSNQISFSNNL